MYIYCKLAGSGEFWRLVSRALVSTSVLTPIKSNLGLSQE